MKLKSSVLVSFAFILLNFLNLGCNSNTSGGQNTVTPIGVVSDAGGFYVTPVPIPNVNTYFHEQSSFTSPCAVAQGVTNAAKINLTCILDEAELDLFYNGFTLNYNAPTTMCNYVRIMPYYYYYYQPGTGPANVAYCKDSTSGNIISVTAGSVSPTGQVQCPFDYSGSGGPNCCYGSYTLTVTTSTNGGACGGASVSTGYYTGQASNCYSGPAMDTQTLDKYKNPLPTLLTTTGKGANGTLKVPSPLSKGFASVVYNANYFNPADTGGLTPTPIVQAYYDFGCLDSAREYIARIRVQVRSWDTVANFTAQSNPYTAGSDPVFADPYHDYQTWHDFLNNFPQLAQ